MTAAARIHAVPAPRPGELLAEGVLFAGRVLLDERSAVLASRIDAGFLAEAGWDPGTWVLRRKASAGSAPGMGHAGFPAARARG